jgi:viologen exporter family transport system permease protein
VTRLTGLPGLYAATMRAAVQTQFQYRTANYAYMLGMVAEPVI